MKWVISQQAGVMSHNHITASVAVSHAVSVMIQHILFKGSSLRLIDSTLRNLQILFFLHDSLLLTGPLIIDSVWLLSLTWEHSRGTRSQSPVAVKKLGWWSQTARNPPSHGPARSRREELVQHGLSAAESQKVKKQASNTHTDNEWEVWEQKSEGKKKRLHLLCHFTAMKACKMSSWAQNW